MPEEDSRRIRPRQFALPCRAPLRQRRKTRRPPASCRLQYRGQGRVATALQNRPANKARMSIDGLVANFAAATDRRYGTAIHEAGHAVVAALIGALGGRVTIEAVHEATGHTWVLTPSGLRKRWRRRWFDQGMRPYTEWQLRYALILACAAGREAEELCLGRCAGRDGTDQQKIAAMLDDLPGADADRDRYAR